MPLLGCKDLRKAYGDREILRGASLTIEPGERLGLIGANGSGKTTLARILAGLEEPDAGEVTRGRELSLAYLAQEPQMDAERTALAAQMKGEDRVVVVFIGEAATEEGVTSESLNFAALKRLPIVFFCENNFYSVQSPLAARQPPRVIHRWAAAHDLPAVHVDGTNVLAVREAAEAAVERARGGGGPTFIEAPVYRFRAHGGAGDDSHTGYRSEAERQAWEPYCPLATFGTFLAGRKVLTRSLLDEMEREIAAEIAEAFAFALASPNPAEISGA